jgi:hypothetical protein
VTASQPALTGAPSHRHAPRPDQSPTQPMITGVVSPTAALELNAEDFVRGHCG